jgi:hypothetical protein
VSKINALEKAASEKEDEVIEAKHKVETLASGLGNAEKKAEERLEEARIKSKGAKLTNLGR